ncbi:MAG: TlpA family protein disulfide reductase [Tannerella sp.]|nr:TlpA family protein disulfide reductase [Tannerella sp.]
MFKFLQNDSSLVSIHEKIEKAKQGELVKFKKLLDNKDISQSFYSMVQIDRDCYYASLEALVSLMKIPSLMRNEDTDMSEKGKDLFENMEKVYTQYPPNNPDWISSNFWGEYAGYYLNDYKQLRKKDGLKKYQELTKGGTINAVIINESKKELTGKELEFFQARHIYFTAIQMDFEKELIELFEQYEKDYPKSEYSKYIRPLIDKIVQYHQTIEQPFNENMRFVDSYEEINTLAEAIKPFNGKKIYIDVWATWCSPCKEEFKNSEALKKILAENDIQMLYISIDKDRDQQWKDMIKFYNLTGNHICANKLLDTDLRKIFDQNGMLSIPWYILVDENGTIIDKHAKSPSQLVAGEKIIKNE